MQRSSYTPPQMRTLRLGQSLMQLNVTSRETIGSHEEGGGEVLSKEYHEFSWEDAESDTEI